MKFSVELSPTCDPAHIPEHARIIEDYGFHHIWIRDMIVVPWELWTALSTVVLSTKKIRVGIDVANPYTRSPAVVAHAAVTMDRISKGRLDLGFGGGMSSLLKGVGIEKRDNGLQECVHIVKSLLEGKRTYFAGDVFQMDGIILPTVPHGKKIPLLLAAMDEITFRLAGELADGVITVSSNEKLLRKAMEWAKRDEESIPLSTWLPFSLSRDKLAPYLEMMRSQLPDDFWGLMDIDKDGLGSNKLIDIFAVSGEKDLSRKVETLSNIGVSEIIFEYFNLSELKELHLLLKGQF